MSVLAQKHFHNEKAAYRFVESKIWPDGPVCLIAKAKSASEE